MSHNIGHDVKHVHCAFLQLAISQRSEETHLLFCPVQSLASGPLLTFARKRMRMALHTLVQCTARLLLAHQQKQGPQQVGISSHDNEEEGMCRDWSLYCTLVDLGMEERVKGGWYVCVCVLRALSGYRLIVLLLLSCIWRHSGSQGCEVWSLTVLRAKLRREHSCRYLWCRQIRSSRKNLPSY